MRSLLARAGALASLLAVLLSTACGSGAATPTAAAPTASPAAPTVTPRPTVTAPVPTATNTVPTALPVLRVGLDAAAPPWSYGDAQGKVAGIDVDLLAMLGREMGVRFEAVNLAPHLLAPELAAGRVDLVVSGLVSTTERARAMALSRPYMTLEQAVVVRGADPAAGPAALSGRTVGVQIGSVAVAEARKAGGTAKVYDDLSIALAALARGEVQAVLGDRPAAAEYLRRHPDQGLKQAGVAGAAQPVALGVAKGNAALLGRVNAALEAMAKRGDLESLARRWLQ